MNRQPHGIRTQTGVTFVGGAILVFFFGLFVLAAIRVLPLYMESLSVSHALASLESSVVGAPTDAAIRSALSKRFSVDDVRSVSAADADITVNDKIVTVQLSYAAEASYIGRLGLVLHFDKSVQLMANDTP